MTRTDRRRFPVLLAVIAVLALAMPMLFSPVQAQEGSAPDQPTGLDATATHGQVVLTWDDPQDDSITGYVILRRIPGVDPEGQFSELVADTGTDATTYTDDTVSAETRYTYRIKAINEHGVSERSRWSHINVPAAPEAAEGDEQDGEDGEGGGGPGKRANVSEGGTDCPDGNTTTCEVDVGGSVTGNTAQALDRDWFKVVLEAGKRYQFDVEGDDTDRGTLADPYLWGLYDSGGSSISGVRSDDGGVGKNGRDTYTPSTGGSYYIATSSGQSTTGTYTLSVIVLGANGNSEGGTDCSADTTTTCEVDVGGSATGNIESTIDYDWFRVDLEAGTEYQIDLEGTATGKGTLQDPHLTLIDGSGNSSLGDDDSSGTGNNSRMTFTLSAAGTYYLQAFGSANTGTYTLSVRDTTPSDDCTADTDTTCEVDVGGSVTGNIENEDDEDWFKVVLEANKTYQIDMKGEYGGGGTLEDPLLDNIRDSSGTGISDTGNDDVDADNDNYDSRTTFTPTTAGAYYLVATTADDSGTYTLSVREIQCTLNEGDIWCGVVTVAEVKSGENLLAHGFADTTSPATLDAGSLAGNPDDRTFLVGDNEYTVQGLYVATGGDRDGWLVFWITDVGHLDDHDEGILVLTIDGVDTPRAFDGNQGVLGGLYQWDADLDWSSTPEVTVRLQTPDDFSAGTTTTGEVDVGGSVTGNIETVADYGDWFKVELEADTRYQIDLEGADTGRGTLVDPAIELLANSIGNTVPNTGGSDSGVGKNDRTIYTPSTSDAYYVVVQPLDTGLGTYTLSVIVLGANGASEADTDFPSTTATTGRVDVGASATGNISTSGDNDLFRVELEAGKEYQFDLEGAATTRGTLSDPYLGLYDGSVSLIATNDDIDSNTNPNSQIVYTATATGAHYLAASGRGGSMGTYTFSVRDVTPESDDCLGDTTTTCEVDVGGSVTGTIISRTDFDWFGVDLETGTRYQIDLEGAPTERGTLPDPDLRLVDGVGLRLDDDESSGVGDNARMIYTPTATGTYYVVAGEVDGETGTYTVSVIVLGANGNSEADADFPETTATTGRVEVEASATGNIETRTDRDWFKVVLEAGKFYRIDLEGEVGGGTLEDPYLRNIRDSSGTEISGTENDDIHGGNSDSRVVFRPTAAGAYYLVASGYGGANDTGTYTLSVTELETRTEEGDTDFAASIATLGRVEVDGSATGEIKTIADADWFRVVLEAGKTYVFDLEGTATSAGTLPDPYLTLLNASGGKLSEDDDGGDGANSRLEYTATASGIHYLEAWIGSFAESDKGTYKLSVREVACTLNEGDIWCGVVTVGTILSGTNTIGHGYAEVTGINGGSFEGDTDITVGSNDYTFEGIFVASTGGNIGALNFKTTAHFTDDDKAALELHIDVDGTSSTWAISDSITTTGVGLILWTTAALDWSEAITVTARLRPLTPGPTVTTVAVTSMPVLETDTYGAGETIEVSVTFSEAVDATSDTDFVLSVGGARRAPLLRGSGTATLVFGYTVVSGDDDDNGIWIGDQDRTLVGNRNGEAQSGTITSVATSAAADLTHDELGTDSDHKVDGSRTTSNVAPSFSSSATISVAENQTTVVTVVATDSDTDDDITGYAITGGADEGFFSIGATSGALTFDAAPNYEDADDSGTNNTYVVDVTATSGAGMRVMTATQTITVTVTDVDTEAPGKPGTPTVSAGSATSLRVNWSAPSNAGPPITRYDVRHRTSSPEGSWTEKNVPSIAAVIENLSENTSYDVQVRAINAEGTGAWSDSGSGTTNAAAALPTLSIGNASADEDDLLIQFAVTLSATASENVSVTCTASFESGDTASAADLMSLTGTPLIAAGSTSGQCAFRPVSDTIDEENETFTVTLSNPSSNAQLATDPTAKGTINDDDDPPTLSVADVSGAEGTALTFTVTLSDESGKTVTVDYATSAETGDTATSGTDFTAKTSTTLTFEPGDPGDTTKTFTVQTTDDTDIEEDETFTVTLSNPSNATLSTTDATAKGTINDDDATDDTTAPSVSSATVSDAGAAIDIVFDEPLDETSTPSFTAFIAGISGIQTDRAVPSNVAVSGDTVTLTIRSGNTIAAGAIVTLAYTAPSTNALADASGNEVESFTGTDAIAVLNRPAAPVVTLTAGNEKLTAMWAAPANGGSAITGYDVEWKTAAQTWAQAGTAGQSDTATADATDHEITGLTNNTEYTVRVRAANDAWDGPWSTEVSETPAASDDCSADTDTICEVDVGGSAMGNIETADDKDYFRIDLVSDTRYQFDLEGDDTTRGSLGDPFLQIANSRGTAIGGTGDRNSGVGDNARVIWTPENIGNESVYLIVEGAASTTGTYTLSVIVLGANGNSEADTDFPITTATTGRVEVGASATGNIETGTDRDWFKVVLEEGKFYQIDLEGSTGGGGTLADPYLRNIRDSSGAEISETGNDDIDATLRNYDSRVIFNPTAAGAYYLVAGGAAMPNTGTYTLSVTEVETRTDEGDTDFASDITTLGLVEVGDSASGEIDPAGDVDWFRVVLEYDKTYVFDLEGTETSSGTLANPRLSVRNQTGVIQYSSDDDGGEGLNSRLEFTALYSGVHYLAASASLSATSGGTYTLSVREVTPTDDCSDDNTTTCEVDVGGSAPGTFETDNDRDWFKVVLEAGTRYQIDVEGADTGRGTVEDPTAVLFDASGTNLAADDLSAADDDGGVDKNARLIYTPTAAGTYYVQAAASFGTAGTYTLSVIVLGANGVSEADTDFPETTATGGRVEVGASATGTIGADTDADWFRVDLEAGKTYQFDLEGADTGRGTQPDPYVVLVNPSAAIELEFDDHGGVGKNARLIYAVDETGTYYVDAGPGNDEQGTYTLSVRDVTPPDDLPADTSTTGEVEVGGAAVRGDIYEPVFVERTGDDDVDGYDFDTDWFAVELEEGRTYRIDMKGAILADDADLTLPLPQINAIYNKYGDYLVNTFDSDESDSHYLFRVTFHAYDDGTYYIAASGESFEWGTYELTVIDITRDVGDYTNVGDDTNANGKQGLKNLRAVEEKGGVRLTWQPPDGAAVTGYRIERRRADEQGSGPQRSHGQPRDHHTLVEDTGNTETSYVDESAEQGVEYEYRVTTRNESGPGEESDWVRAGPEEEPVLGDGLPGAPRNLTATPGNREVSLSWDPPADNGNAPATRYRIEWRVDGQDYGTSQWGTSRETTYTTNDQANLANGVKYFFRVKAENGSGNSYGPYGPASEEVSATPTSGSAVDLGTPVLSDTETLHHGMVRLDWEDIEDAGWYVVQHYHLEDEEWLDLPAEGVDIAFHGSSAVVSNLHGLSWLRVRAMSCAGSSEWSQIEQLFGTNASDWEGVPVPEVEEGDEIEPCPVVLGTPVLSDTEILHHGMVQLDWQDIEDAGWYVVQYYHLEDEEWLDLPAEGVDIAFHGSSAVVSNLHGLSWLRVGAASCDGASEWSQIEELYGTNASDWNGVPVPEVAEGDEIEPCSEDADTPDNSPATGAPTISGTSQVGETLTANTSGIADADGLSNVQYEYQWLADDADISGATNATYTLVADDEGKAVTVQVSFTDDAGNEETLTSAATDAVAAAPVHAKSAPDLEVGTPSVYPASPFAGSQFTLSVTVTNAGDGASEATRLRGYRSTDSTITTSDTEEGSQTVSALAAAGSSSFDHGLTAPSEAGTYYYGVCVDSVTDESDTTNNCSSSVAVTVSEPAPDLVVTGIDATDNIVTGGSFRVGVTVTNMGDAQSAATTLRWKKEVDGTTTEIGTSALSALTRLQGGFKTIRLTAPSTPGTSSYWACVDSVADESDATNNCSGRVTVTVTNNLATGAPTITGTAQVSQTLTASTSDISDSDGLDNVSYDYQWLADDSEIDGATSSTYTIQASDNGKVIKVQVTFTDDADNEETLTSAATGAVAGAQPTEPPDKPRNLSATATHDSVTLTWDDPGDDSITGYVILRRIPGDNPEGHFDVLAADTETAATTYTDDTVSAETRYTYRIKAINGAGTSERSRWSHIDVPAAPVPDKPTGLEATVSHGQVVLTWDDPGDDSITGYVILRRVRENDTGGDFSVLVADTGTAALTYTDDTVAAGLTYTYRIKAINEHGISERSRWYHIDIPAAP